VTRSLAAGIVALATALAGAAAAQGVDKSFAHSVRPKGLAEECFKLPAGQSMGYSFASSAPVDFNIHFHRGNDVVYPVKTDGAQVAADRFTAPSTEEFCLMWTNRTLEMVTVKGRLAP
jgi:hypothetical protein